MCPMVDGPKKARLLIYKENTPDHIKANMLMDWNRTIFGSEARGFTEEPIITL